MPPLKSGEQSSEDSDDDWSSVNEERMLRLVSREVYKLEERMVATLREIKESLSVDLRDTADTLQRDTQSVAGRLQQSFVVDVQKLVRRIEGERDERVLALSEARKGIDRHCCNLEAEVCDLKREVSSLELRISDMTHADRHLDEGKESLQAEPTDTPGQYCLADGSTTSADQYIVALQLHIDENQKHIATMQSQLTDMRKDINKQVEMLHQHGNATQSIFTHIQQDLHTLLTERTVHPEQNSPCQPRNSCVSSCGMVIDSESGKLEKEKVLLEQTGKELTRCMDEIRSKLDDLENTRVLESATINRVPSDLASKLALGPTGTLRSLPCQASLEDVRSVSARSVDCRGRSRESWWAPTAACQYPPSRSGAVRVLTPMSHDRLSLSRRVGTPGQNRHTLSSAAPPQVTVPPWTVRPGIDH